MRIRTNTWHLKVFLQAHVQDRFWLDARIANPNEECKTPETEAYNAFQKTFEKLPLEERSNEENQKCLHELANASETAFVEWRKQKEAIYTSNRSREVSERLYSGKMSLCPYFWSVVSALVFYYGFIRSTRPLRNFFNRIAEGLATAVGALIVLGIVGLMGFGIYAILDEIPTPVQVVVSVKRSVQEYQQARLQEKAAAALQQKWAEQQAQNQKVWAQQHPVEVQREKAQQAEADGLAREQNWKDFKKFAQDFGWFVLAFIGLALGIAVFVGLFYLIGIGLNCLAIRYGWGTAKEPKPLSALDLWLARVWEFLAPFRRFCKDTKELVLAFAKAKKEKVCPYLEIVNDEMER